MINALAGQISIRHGLRGPNYITASACASSSHAIGLAMWSIRRNEADVIVTGGSEATITELAMAGFSNMKAMSKRNDDPERASRPFDKDRDGFVMGEGAGMLVFEELERAKARGATIYAEVKGFGMTADAHHITAPTPEGTGPAKAMRKALEDGGVDPERVNYINAHGTSTPLNDAAETRAIRTVLPITTRTSSRSASSKSMVGHLLGGSGGVELVLSACMVRDKVLHPTINYETPDPDCDLDYVPNEARDFEIDHALSNSLGFGGHNVSILFSRYHGMNGRALRARLEQAGQDALADHLDSALGARPRGADPPDRNDRPRARVRHSRAREGLAAPQDAVTSRPSPTFALREPSARPPTCRRARREAALRAGKVAFALMAGGQASRLKVDGPKGCFPIGPRTDRSLFQLFAEHHAARGQGLRHAMSRRSR